MTDRSFYGFPDASKEDWIRKALKDAKLQSADQLNYWAETEGIEIPPFFTQEDVPRWSWLMEYDKGLFDEGTGKSPQGWKNIVSVDLDSQWEVLSKVLFWGIEGVVLEWSGEGDLDKLLGDLHPAYISIWLKPKGNALKTLKIFLKWISKKEIKSGNLKGGLLYDPFTDLLLNGEDVKVLEEVLKIHQLTKAYPDFKGNCIDFSLYMNTGGCTVKQLAFGVGAMIESLAIITENEPVESYVKNAFVFVGVGGDYFLNIAKLKVLRILISKMLSLYGLHFLPGELTVFAVTSLWNKSHVDIETNMVRNTAEALMAVQGGADLIHVRPHDVLSSGPDVHSMRIASNIPNILKLEGHLDKVRNLSAGAYYVYYLEEVLYDAAIEKLKLIEGNGGWLSTYMKGLIQKEVKEDRQKQLNDLLEKKEVQIGVNTFSEGVKIEVPGKWGEWNEADNQLRPISKSLLFEKHKNKLL